MIDPAGVSAGSPALIEDKRGKVLALIEPLVRECPERQPTGEGERRALRIVQESFEALGLRTEFQPFEFNDNLYSNLALHFGLGTLGTVVSGIFPLAGSALHLAAGSSFFLDATRQSEVDVLSYPIPDWLQRTFQRVAASEPRFAKVEGHRPPVGGTDVAAFLARGWDAGALLCIDPELGSPRHCHTPSDTPENLEVEPLFEAIEFVEKVVDAVVETRLGGPIS